MTWFHHETTAMEPRNPVEFDGFPIEMPVEFGVSDSQVMGADRHHLRPAATAPWGTDKFDVWWTFDFWILPRDTKNQKLRTSKTLRAYFGVQMLQGSLGWNSTQSPFLGGLVWWFCLFRGKSVKVGAFALWFDTSEWCKIDPYYGRSWCCSKPENGHVRIII